MRLCDAYMRLSDAYMRLRDAYMRLCDAYMRLCDAYMRLCDYRFYLLIPPTRLLHSVQSFSFKLSRNNLGILC